jgi:hypothetical protein
MEKTGIIIEVFVVFAIAVAVAANTIILPSDTVKRGMINRCSP